MNLSVIVLLFCQSYQFGSGQSTTTSAHPAAVSELARVKDAFIHDGVIPDVLESFNPSLLMKVTYPSGNPASTVTQPGQRLTEETSVEQPQIFLRVPEGIHFNPIDYRATGFTFVIIDPDAPSRINPTARSFLHMLAVNVQMISGEVTSTYSLDFATEPVVVPYRSPTPPSGTGYHRYMFLLFSGQPTPASIVPFQGPQPLRAGFDLQKFIAQSGLTSPIAGTFVQIKHSNNER